MAPAANLRGVGLTPPLMQLRTGEVARGTGATWRHRHIGPKSAPVTAISDRERKESFN